VMRMLVHYHAYGDAAKVLGLAQEHSGRIYRQVDLREDEEVGRLQAEYQVYADKLAALDVEITAARAKLDKPREKLAAKVAERDERIGEARRRANDDRQDVARVGQELVALYADADELLKHARVVGRDEIEENEFNLNIPRYVDTFEPEPRMEVKDALKSLKNAADAASDATTCLTRLLEGIGYARTDTH